MNQRVECHNAGCHNCEKSAYAGKTLIFGDKLYTCSANPMKHKEVNARDCNQFRCNNPNEWNFCRDCRKGK